MAETADYSWTQQGLVQQGYLGYSPDELRKLAWGLRFTPSVCMLGALIGLATRTPWIHFVLAGLGVLALATPAHHPFDMLYNYLVRLVTGGPELPPNPLPRRVACALGGAMNLGIGLSFQAGQVLLAYMLGVFLVALQIIVISSNFCVASWLLELMFMLRGGASGRVSGPEAHRIVEQQGGLLVDVRSREEFGLGHLPGALNIPIGELETRVQELCGQGRPLVLYCASGVRSYKAADLLRRRGAEQVHELGPMKAWGTPCRT